MKVKLKISKERWQATVRLAFRTLLSVLRLVPWPLALAGSSAIGALACRVSERYHRIADKNLKLAYGDAMTDRQRRDTIKRVFQNFTRVLLVEFLKGANMSLAETRRRVKLDTLVPLETALERGKGVILISAHLGNWEWLFKRLALEGHPLLNVVRQSEDEQFNALTDQVRGTDGNEIHPRGASPRLLLKHLRENKRIVILPDQKAEDVFVPFFGTCTGTVAGPAVLGLRTGAALLPTFCPRQADGTYRVVFYPAILPESTGDRDADVRRIMAQLTLVIEDIIRQYPEQWLWLHDRWRVLPSAEMSIDVPLPAIAH